MYASVPRRLCMISQVMKIKSSWWIGHIQITLSVVHQTARQKFSQLGRSSKALVKFKVLYDFSFIK